MAKKIKHIDRIPFFKYWVQWPIEAAVDTISDVVRKIHIKASGKWYCIYCGEWHHRRDRKYYKPYTGDDPVCYRALQPKDGGCVNG